MHDRDGHHPDGLVLALEVVATGGDRECEVGETLGRILNVIGEN